MTGTTEQIGFVGLGVMGEPICRNLARKSALRVTAHDLNAEPLERLARDGVIVAAGLKEVSAGSLAVFLSLPSGEIVEDICLRQDGLLENSTRGQFIVDTSTTPVGLTRDLAAKFAQRGVTFVDAPVARTRAAAEEGTLSVMVGAEERVFAQLLPLIETFASDVTLCGTVGCGQVVKILNNMVLFETVMALSEAKAIAERSGVDAELLFETLTKGSADSFALRNHGLKAIIPGLYPERAFSVVYAKKDLRYAIELAKSVQFAASGALLVDQWLNRAIQAGYGDRYHPVISRLIGAALTEGLQTKK